MTDKWTPTDRTGATTGGRQERSTSLPELRTKEQIDHFVDEVMTALDKVIEATVPITKPSQRVKTYWNKEYTSAITKAKSLIK